MPSNLPPLNRRLEAVASLVPQGRRIVDVGTDHAFLPLYLLLSGRVSGAICSDINPGPLEIAEKNIKQYCPRRVETILSDGLENIPYDKDDCIIIAGMGGETIAGILQADKRDNDMRCFVLQPMSRVPSLRRYLAENGFGIIAWKLAEDRGRIYECLCVCQNGHTETDPVFLTVGRPDGQPSELYKKYIDKVVQNIENELSGVRRAAASPKERIEALENILDGLYPLKGDNTQCIK